MPNLEVHPLTPERWDDLVDLFRQDRDPRWCWCMWWRLRAKDFSANRVADNRAGLEALTTAAAADGGPAPGLLAYMDDRAVGWVSLGPRDDFERLRRSKVIPRVDDRPVWSVVCFVVNPQARGTGLARRLLDAAVAYAREHGAQAIEAYPVDPEGQRLEPEALFPGAVRTFRAAGFEGVGSRLTQSGQPRPDRPIVRLDLG